MARAFACTPSIGIVANAGRLANPIGTASSSTPVSVMSLAKSVEATVTAPRCEETIRSVTTVARDSTGSQISRPSRRRKVRTTGPAPPDAVLRASRDVSLGADVPHPPRDRHGDVGDAESPPAEQRGAVEPVREEHAHDQPEALTCRTPALQPEPLVGHVEVAEHVVVQIEGGRRPPSRPASRTRSRRSRRRVPAR